MVAKVLAPALLCVHTAALVWQGFALMMKDAFLYHRCGSEGIVNLLERFFSFELETAEKGILVYKQ